MRADSRTGQSPGKQKRAYRKQENERSRAAGPDGPKEASDELTIGRPGAEKSRTLSLDAPWAVLNRKPNCRGQGAGTLIRRDRLENNAEAYIDEVVEATLRATFLPGDDSEIERIQRAAARRAIASNVARAASGS